MEDWYLCPLNKGITSESQLPVYFVTQNFLRNFRDIQRFVHYFFLIQGQDVGARSQSDCVLELRGLGELQYRQCCKTVDQSTAHQPRAVLESYRYTKRYTSSFEPTFHHCFRPGQIRTGVPLQALQFRRSRRTSGQLRGLFSIERYCNIFTSRMLKLIYPPNTIKKTTTPNGYIVPAEFGDHFLPRMKNIPKQTKLHLNEIGSTNIEFCIIQIRLRQPPISWEICYFSTICNTGVRVNVTAKL